MAHTHASMPGVTSRVFALGITLNSIFIVVEILFGLSGHSLALVADAGHNLGDVLGLGLSWAAMQLSQRPPTTSRTYGWRRSSILAALANAALLFIATGAIAWEAIHRLAQPAPVAGGTMIAIAALGMIINSVTALGFMTNHNHDLNVRSAFTHLAADAMLAFGVVVAGILILATGWVWLDPVASLLLVAVIVAGTWGLLRDSLNLAMDAVPPGIDLLAIRNFLATLPDVDNVHDLHVWGMSTTESALTAHLVMPNNPARDAQINRICSELHLKYGIEHATLQIECGDPNMNCPFAPEHTV